MIRVLCVIASLSFSPAWAQEPVTEISTLDRAKARFAEIERLGYGDLTVRQKTVVDERVRKDRNRLTEDAYKKVRDLVARLVLQEAQMEALIVNRPPGWAIAYLWLKDERRAQQQERERRQRKAERELREWTGMFCAGGLKLKECAGITVTAADRKRLRAYCKDKSSDGPDGWCVGALRRLRN